MPTQNVILSVCRVYLPKRSTDKAVFQHFAQYLTLIEQPGSGELMLIVQTDRQTDRQTDNEHN